MHGSKKSKRFSVLLALILFVQLAIPSGTFAAASDISGHWSQKSLERMISLGIMAGYTDGSIKPDNNITRAEFFTIVNKAFGIETTTKISFTDVKDKAWY
ncbi:MAG: S-layer homology domain-containing protein [Clostridiaceae bacterium]|nr:S-layer homology domain-containing protein [Clostridiaceae bacterium]